MQKIADQQGAVRRITILVMSLLLVSAVLAVVAWRMSGDDIDPDIRQVLDNANCEFVEDDDLCKFFASWNAAGSHTIDATENTEDSTVTQVLKVDNGSFQLETSGDESGETIAVGNTVYIRGDDDTWYEQTVDDDRVDEYKQSNDFDFVEPNSQDEANAVQYTRSSTETCGERTCFTYQVEGLSDQGTMRIWFDDQEYRLRQVRVVGSEGYSYDASVSYGDVEIEVPDETTVLAEGQTIPPGQTSPTQGEVQGDSNNNDNLPATGDQFDPEEYRQWLESRGNG